MPTTPIRSVNHLFWRAGMGLSPQEARAAANAPYNELVDRLFSESVSCTPITTAHTVVSGSAYRAMKPTEQFKYRRASREAQRRLNALWRQKLITTHGCLREKMALFWHGHFVAWTYWSNCTEQYLNTLREHALGDLGTLLKRVSRTPAMLAYLSNQLNRKDAPNENFAREVMELFTLGRGHYTEQDIKEAARAFTGWSFELGTASFNFHEKQHDFGEKTFRGHTGNFDGDDILGLLLADPRTAEFISRKMYRWFVSPEVNEQFVAQMADRFFKSEYDIADLMRFVFTSDQFKDPAILGRRIKSPVELLCGLDKNFTLRFEREEDPLFLQRLLGQELLNPPNVSGWKEGDGWVDSNALMLRLKLPSALLNMGQLNWEDRGASTGDLDKMMSTPDTPMRDAKGRVFRTAPDKAAFLAQLPPNITNEDLFELMLQVPPTEVLRSSMGKGDLMERVLELPLLTRIPALLMRRRDFLRSTGLVTSGLLAPRFLHGMVGALPLGGRKLVVVQLTGGNDGLNTIVPLQNDDYHRLRPKLALAPGVALPVSDGLGLNPGMEAIRRLFDDGRVCVINGVGYPDPDHSHFRSMDIWQTASNSSEYLDTGWLGRYLDARSIAPHDVVEFGGTLSLANKGQRMKAITLTDPARFFQATREPWFAQLASVRHEEEHRELGLLYRTMVETYRSAGYIHEHLRPRTTGITYPKGDLARQLQHVSAFIQSGMDTSVYYTSTGGFDTHVNQLVKHQKLWTGVSDGIAAFLNDLRTAGLGKEVLVMVFSEFGRRAKENASNGTDHGTAGPVLLFGEGLRKPGFFNPVPSLSRLDDNGDLVFSTDFRRIYATLLKDWLDTDPAAVIGGRFEKIPVL